MALEPEDVLAIQKTFADTITPLFAAMTQAITAALADRAEPASDADGRPASPGPVRADYAAEVSFALSHGLTDLSEVRRRMAASGRQPIASEATYPVDVELCRRVLRHAERTGITDVRKAWADLRANQL